MNDEFIKEKTNQSNKVIFGAVYGMCGGDCRDLFMINEEDLYKDADNFSDEYGNWSNTTFDQKLREEEYNKTADLLNIPTNLLENEISQEDLVQKWADVDYYLYIEKDGISKEIILDYINEDADPAIKSYFRTFFKNYKDLGGYAIDTTIVGRW
ncbi:hypothetical protein L1I30_14295 [Gillisia sp. M10.2A]|uniref:Uncharacterized protein n=1 Tax=Gillisia lutea TaxID=2909668 RepID=A0ABS9EJ06_9FLAO|nr:hypothetical protein [Gillisia lutea]MCF4102845.1 hypothetical protein [Gillisia lutea]